MFLGEKKRRVDEERWEKENAMAMAMVTQKEVRGVGRGGGEGYALEQSLCFKTSAFAVALYHA